MANAQKRSKSQQNSFIFAFLSWLLAAQGGHWLITPIRHPLASTTQYVLVWLQIAIGLAIGIWQYRKSHTPLKTNVME